MDDVSVQQIILTECGKTALGSDNALEKLAHGDMGEHGDMRMGDTCTLYSVNPELRIKEDLGGVL